MNTDRKINIIHAYTVIKRNTGKIAPAKGVTAMVVPEVVLVAVLVRVLHWCLA